jgi:hypothetical protein
MTTDLRGHGAAALILAGALAVLAVVHATHGAFDDQLTTTADYLNDGSFSVALIAFAFAVQGLGILGAPRWPVRLAATGALLVAAGLAPALATGESPDWFAAVGVPGNLLWLIGTVMLARWAWRSGALPRWLAAGIGLTVPSALILAELGGSLIAAIVWAVIGLRWLGALGNESAHATAPHSRRNRTASATHP